MLLPLFTISGSRTSLMNFGVVTDGVYWWPRTLRPVTDQWDHLWAVIGAQIFRSFSKPRSIFREHFTRKSRTGLIQSRQTVHRQPLDGPVGKVHCFQTLEIFCQFVLKILGLERSCSNVCWSGKTRLKRMFFYLKFGGGRQEIRSHERFTACPSLCRRLWT